MLTLNYAVQKSMASENHYLQISEGQSSGCKDRASFEKSFDSLYFKINNETGNERSSVR